MTCKVQFGKSERVWNPSTEAWLLSRAAVAWRMVVVSHAACGLHVGEYRCEVLQCIAGSAVRR